jgi:hypothetical protein
LQSEIWYLVSDIFLKHVCSDCFNRFKIVYDMTKTKIWRQAYRRLRQAQLAVYAQNVVQRTKDNPAYASLQTFITALDTLQQRYAQALASAQDGGRAGIVAKEQLKAQVLAQLGALADALNDFADGDPTLIANAGFDLLPESTRNLDILPPPVVLRAVSTGKSGELRIILQDAFPNLVRHHGIEYSNDDGKTYQNNTYDSRSRFILRDLPRASTILLRFSSLGRGNNRSAWSQAVAAAVL